MAGKLEIGMGNREAIIEILRAIIVIGIITAAIFIGAAHSLDASSKVPVLLYHSRNVGPDCSPDDTDVLAFERDIQILRSEGYVIRPLLEVAYWHTGRWSGTQLPDKVAAISFDDGFDRDWLSKIPSPVAYPDYPCPDLPSVKQIAEEYTVPVTFFVIASRPVRELIQPDYMGDNWWREAEKHPLFMIGNHSLDHEHRAVEHQIYDPAIPALMPAAGHADGIWRGQNDPGRWTNYPAATFAIQRSARRIREAIGNWPPLFAHPMGYASGYVQDVYLPHYGREHHTLAAFCTTAGTPELFLTRASDTWCLPRMGHLSEWRTGDELRAILRGAK